MDPRELSAQARATVGRLLRPLGPAHPESTTRPLTPEQETVLARIAAVLADGACPPADVPEPCARA